ncbi:TIM barrel protein [Rhodobacteraceae bacterium 2CG4]|uniref:TIM barrel protein n=1 Tax=Halovulum marinum TaxID=2662447 RepID=A0A6L5YUB1_9RHOB|nr:TIM barrel protein [Halovulum marinum]MSU88016.1 TIM barrel protein [Halovulum marinum]
MTAPAFLPGLCSVTFRQLAPPRIAALAAEAGLRAVEWGMDGHLPPGDAATARRLRALAADHGLITPTAGSYLRCDDPAEDPAPTLDAAAELGARCVRVWAGRQGSDRTGDRAAAVVATLRRHCEAAAGRGLVLGLEYHRNTLTDTPESAARLLAEVDHPALVAYWQPRGDGTRGAMARELAQLAPHLAHLHVFHWRDYADRLPLAQGRALWAERLAAAAATPAPEAGPRCAFLEFVRGDDPEAFREDAAILIGLLNDTADTKIKNPVGG